MAVGLKYKLGYDDSLDVVGVHLVGGIVGTLLIGFFATDAYIADSKLGLFYGGGAELLGKQAIAAGSSPGVQLRCHGDHRIWHREDHGFGSRLRTNKPVSMFGRTQKPLT